MRLIKVAFISILRAGESPSNLLCIYKNNKQYAFYTDNVTVEIGDIINHDAYNSPMLVMDIISGLPQVARVTNELRKQGIHIITLALAYSTSINGKHIYKGMNTTIKQENNMEEKRNIKVTLEQAIEWYNSNNATLRTLALSAYTEDELKFNLNYIFNKICKDSVCIVVPMGDDSKYNTLADLAVIAKYFNGNWKKSACNTGYFLGSSNEGCGPVVDYCNGVGIYQHNTVQYAGIVYFRNKEDAIKAVKILGKKVKNLFD